MTNPTTMRVQAAMYPVRRMRCIDWPFRSEDHERWETSPTQFVVITITHGSSRGSDGNVARGDERAVQFDGRQQWLRLEEHGDSRDSSNAAGADGRGGGLHAPR